MRIIDFFYSNSSNSLNHFFKSSSFSKAIMVGLAVVLPISVGIISNNLEIGIAIGFGAFWCSPSDVSGSFKHKRNGIFISAILITIVSFIGGFLNFQDWYTLVVIGLLTFLIAYISVYGFRASLISFSGLLALVLSFAHEAENISNLQNALFVGVGGMWYLLLSSIWYFSKPNSQTDEELSKTFWLTADFIENRADLMDGNNDRNTLQDNLLKVQAELVEHHETLREILILSRRSSGKSAYRGKRLLVFIQLIEMLETAIANPVNYKKMDTFFKQHPEHLKSYQKIVLEMADQLSIMANRGFSGRKLPKNKKLSDCIQQLKKEVAKLKNDAAFYSDFIMIQNLIEYQEKQFEKIKQIKWLLGNPNLSSVEKIKQSEAKRFIVAQDYDPKILLRNLNFRSTIFKHSMRLATVMMLGYLLGSLFAFQNPYWILLTIIVILRPSYGLTKNRAKDRIIGTIIGGAIAFLLVLFVHNVYFLATLGILSLVIAFSLLQKNYKTAAVFITLSVVFIYAIIQDDIIAVIKFRLFDTFIGAVLSFTAMLWLWPAWTYQEIHDDIKKSVKANKDFFRQIVIFYKERGAVPTALKVSRKHAFLETSNLSSAFQRMAQEPHSKQKKIAKVYEFVELNHTVLSSLASMSAYVQNHPTSKATIMFEEVSEMINNNLSVIIHNLENNIKDNSFDPGKNLKLFKDRLQLFRSQMADRINSGEAKTDRKQQEAHLIWEQLNWLTSATNRMLKLSTEI